MGSHGLHGLHVGDGVAAWMEKKERQLLVPALCVFSSVIALVCDTAEVLHTEEKWSFLLHLLHVFPKALQSFTLASRPPSPCTGPPQFLHFLNLPCFSVLCLSRPTDIPGLASLPASSAVHHFTRDSRSLMDPIMACVRALSFIDWSDSPESTLW